MAILEQIQREFHRKGWRLYQMDDIGTLEQLVSRGPAVTLEKGERYAVLPEISNPYDHRAMKKVLEYLTGEERAPCMHFGNERVLTASILMQKHRVIINGELPRKFSYYAFYEHMATLPSVKAN